MFNVPLSPVFANQLSAMSGFAIFHISYLEAQGLITSFRILTSQHLFAQCIRFFELVIQRRTANRSPELFRSTAPHRLKFCPFVFSGADNNHNHSHSHQSPITNHLCLQ